MADNKTNKFLASAGQATKALHAGLELQNHESQTEILHKTTAFHFHNTEHAANLFGLRELGQIYSRLTNPTQDMLEARMAALDGGAAALALASGTSAIFYTIINTLKHGEELVASRNLYGGSYTMLTAILPQFGIKAILVDPNKPEEFDAAINERTRLIYAETIGNPLLEVIDLEAIAKIAQKHKLPFAVDATFTPPTLLRPIEHGANIVIHSLTKWYNGHANLIGGGVVDAGNFDWNQEKFSLYTQPDAGYHGLRFGIDLPAPLKPIAFILRMRTVPLRNLGAAIAPDSAWQAMQGVKTLALRTERQSESAHAISKFLSSQKQVEWVRYPGMEGDPGYTLAKKYLKQSRTDKNAYAAGGMVSFALKGGCEAGQRFIDALQLFAHVANVGDVRSLAIHPASTTHSQLSANELKAAGVDAGLVRLSIGIEDYEDILNDIRQALASL